MQFHRLRVRSQGLLLSSHAPGKLYLHRLLNASWCGGRLHDKRSLVEQIASMIARHTACNKQQHQESSITTVSNLDPLNCYVVAVPLLLPYKYRNSTPTNAIQSIRKVASQRGDISEEILVKEMLEQNIVDRAAAAPWKFEIRI